METAPQDREIVKLLDAAVENSARAVEFVDIACRDGEGATKETKAFFCEIVDAWCRRHGQRPGETFAALVEPLQIPKDRLRAELRALAPETARTMFRRLRGVIAEVA